MSKLIEEILTYNATFVSAQRYEQYRTSKLPDKKLAVLSCMDTRLTELLPAALGCKNGDIKLIKNAGGIVSHPFGSVMRSLLVCIYEMNVSEIAVIGHHDCGMCGFNATEMMDKMIARGISSDTLRSLKYYGIDLDRWLTSFTNTRESIVETVAIIKNHPLIPEDVAIHGLMIDPESGRLNLIC